MALVFDIETVGEEWSALDEATRSQLTRWLKKESRDDAEYESGLEDLKNGLGFSPLTGFIVAIGVFDTDKEKGAVFFSAPDTKIEDREEEGIKYKVMSEADMLESFWSGASVYDEFVSFNGRGFDVPFIMLRSAVHRVPPTKNLFTYRYIESQRSGPYHIDLQDQLTFYGAWHKKPSLHMFCRAFGIPSPKAEGVTGDEVAELYASKKYLEIAKYNAGDLRATSALYLRWKETFR